MNIQSTLTVLFPAGVVVDCGPSQSGSLEVHGLPKGTVPQNCEVLACGRIARRTIDQLCGGPVTY